MKSERERSRDSANKVYPKLLWVVGDVAMPEDEAPWISNLGVWKLPFLACHLMRNLQPSSNQSIQNVYLKCIV